MSNHVRQIQTDLKNAGLYIGAIDGIAGRLTVEAVQKALGIEPTATVPNSGMQLSEKGIDLIKEFEGFRSAPYKDAVGIPTIGYGNTYYLDGRKVSMSDKPLSKQEAHDLKLAITNRDFVPKVRKLLENSKVPVTQEMFDALVSLAYNIGTGAFERSSVLRHLVNGDKKAAADAILMWNKAGGKVLAGLTRRRQAERELFLA